MHSNRIKLTACDAQSQQLEDDLGAGRDDCDQRDSPTVAQFCEITKL